MKRFGLLALIVSAFVSTSCTSIDLVRTVNQEPTQKPITDHSANLPDRAQNVILFIGDGMGLSTVTAARIYAGQSLGKSGEAHNLSFEQLPYSALSKVYNSNQQVPDSAGTATAMLSGEKTLSGVIGIGSNSVRGDCESALANSLETIVEQAEDYGLSTGIVSTARITHATPAAAYAHSADRNWENDSELPEQTKCADIAKQLIEFSHGNGIDIVLGGGLTQFRDKQHGGWRSDGQDLIAKWQAKHRGDGAFVQNLTQLQRAASSPTTKIFGLFSPSHMSFEVDRQDKNSPEPSLTDMTTAALDHLQKLDQRYFLLIEAGRIDHAHHAGNAARALIETVELSNAVSAALSKVDRSDTLVIVTADHGHTLNMGGYPTRGNPILGYVVENNPSGQADSQPKLATNNQPYTTLSYANGPGATLPRSNTDDPQDINYRQIASVPTQGETHSGTDVPVYAGGPGAQQFRGVIEQNLIYHYMIKALGLNY